MKSKQLPKGENVVLVEFNTEKGNGRSAISFAKSIELPKVIVTK